MAALAAILTALAPLVEALAHALVPILLDRYGSTQAADAQPVGDDLRSWWDDRVRIDYGRHLRQGGFRQRGKMDPRAKPNMLWIGPPRRNSWRFSDFT